MSNYSPDARFGIKVGRKRSSYWRVRAGAAKPELFLEREGHGKRFHVSLHASGQWHLKVDDEEKLQWTRPDEEVPGYTRAIGIVQPVVVAHRDDVAPDDVVLVAVSAEAAPTIFSIYIEQPGANLDGWPGKMAIGTAFAGRIPLAVGTGTCCIVACQGPLQPGRGVYSQLPSEAELAWMRENAARGDLYGTVLGAFSDGAIAVIDLRAARDALAFLEPTQR